jgi:serine O-acetyltransferase
MSNFLDQLHQNHLNSKIIPSTQKSIDWVNSLVAILFPDCCQSRYADKNELELKLKLLQTELQKIHISINNFDNFGLDNQADQFFQILPQIYENLKKDVKAILDGDPAAHSEHEVILTYPGFYAIARHRIAHELYNLNIPLLPRIISEHVHSKTGIDLHPGATIGESFCIDHGTGIVIGETTMIGNNVKIYQGVTLGALSVSKDLANHKRHPTIQDNVVIYANATILGGETVIGQNSIIGGNVWITKSVEPNSKIYHRSEVIVK